MAMTTIRHPRRRLSTEHPTDLQVVGESYMLRLATPDDAEQLFDLGEDPAVTRFFRWGPYTSIDQPLSYIEDLQRPSATTARCSSS